ncbi:WG repeat-containing protein [Massilia rubra]|uniref:WG repeat-containing protein n=1 Tax=Massilia rubra TaxID=2607910 RepID=A0ABX0LQJ8_9BURK|nr:WG repeat-containing protein [Massilia rubra]NHZ34983.1 WG repeat-containing protein [Massilia rubra]
MPTQPLLVRNYFHPAGTDADLLLWIDGRVIAPVTPLRWIGRFADDGHGGMIAPAHTMDQRAGYIGADGAWLAGPGMDKALAFTADGLARFCDGGLWGFVNLAGERVIAAQYAGAEGFSNGLAAVKVSDDQWRYIDCDGQFAFDGAFSHAGKFSACGLAAAAPAQDQPWGYIDRQGQWAIAPRFYRAWAFSAGGVAPAGASQGKWGLIDTGGHWIMPASFEFIAPFNDDGYASFSDSDSDDEPGGYLDPLGVKVIGGKWVSTKMHAGVATNGDRGFVTADGPLTFPVELRWVRKFDDSGYALARTADFAPGVKAMPVAAVWGFTHRDGRFVPAPENALEPLTLDGFIPDNESDTPLTPFLMRDGQIHLLDSEARTVLIWQRELCAGGACAALYDHAGQALWRGMPCGSLTVHAPFFVLPPESFLVAVDTFEQIPGFAASMLDDIESRLHELVQSRAGTPRTTISHRVMRIYISEPHNTEYDFLGRVRSGTRGVARERIIAALEQRFGPSDTDPDLAGAGERTDSIAWPVQLRQPVNTAHGAREDANRLWIAIYCDDGSEDADAWFDIWMDCGPSIETLEMASAGTIAGQEDPDDDDDYEEDTAQDEQEDEAPAGTPYEQWIAAVKRREYAIEEVPAELMDDVLCETALAHGSGALLYLSARWQTPERLASLVRKDVYSAVRIPPACMTAAALALARALYGTDPDWQEADAEASTVPPYLNDYSIGKVWGCLLDYEQCLRAVRERASLASIPRWLRTPELEAIALDNDIGDIRWLDKSDITPDLVRRALSTPDANANAVRCIPAALMTTEMCLLAVRTEATTLRSMAPELRTAEICAAALEKDRYILADVPDAVREPAITRLIDKDLRSSTAIRDQRTFSKWHKLRAWIKLFQKDYQGAIADATLALQAIPDSADAHYILAHAFRETGEHDAAARAAFLALSIDSDYREEFNHNASTGWLRPLAKRAVTNVDDAALLARVATNPGALAGIPRWRVTREMVDLALGADAATVAFVPKRLMTPELYALALARNVKQFRQIPAAFKNEAFCLAAVHHASFGLYYVPEAQRTLALCIAAARDSSMALDYVPAALLDEVLRAPGVRRS